MPIYEYECAKCGKTIEVMQKMSDKPLKKHQGCGGGLTKLISASGFHFKGTGWYVTDYARKGSVSEKVDKELSSPEPSTKSDDAAKSKNSPAKKTGSDKS